MRTVKAYLLNAVSAEKKEAFPDFNVSAMREIVHHLSGKFANDLSSAFHGKKG